MGAAAATAPARDWEAPAWEAPLFDLKAQITAPVKIASVELLRREKTYFVRVQSSDGVTGIVKTKEIEDFVPIFLRRVAPFFVGRDARDLERLMDDLYIQHYKISGQAFWLPAAQAEHAVWDLLGRTAQKPVAALLGAKTGGIRQRAIPVYLSGSGREETAEREVEIYVEGMKETGAAGFKLKIGGRMSRNADAYPGRTEKMLELARARAGDRAVLYADANGSYDYTEAVRIGRLMERSKYQFFEEPCPWEENSLTKRVADTLDIPIAAGECDNSLWRFQWLLENNAAQIIQPDLNYCGGIVRAARVARMAQAVGVPITPHSTETGAAGAKMLHFAAAIPNIGPYMEWPYRGKSKPASWYTPELKICDGQIPLPEGPGFGVEFDPDYWKSAELLRT